MISINNSNNQAPLLFAQTISHCSIGIGFALHSARKRLDEELPESEVTIPPALATQYKAGQYVQLASCLYKAGETSVLMDEPSPLPH